MDYEHIIRTKQDLHRIMDYIEANRSWWDEDENQVWVETLWRSNVAPQPDPTNL
jgi:hypothetical protein